jgi:hypothetical protein
LPASSQQPALIYRLFQHTQVNINMQLKILSLLALPLFALGIALPDPQPELAGTSLKTLSQNVTTLGPDTYENLQITVEKYKAEHAGSFSKRDTCFGV